MWLAESEGAKFYEQILNELQSRGVEEILILCCDGLKGLPEAVASFFLHTIVQTCIVHLVRRSLSFVRYKERKVVAADLKPIYQAATESEALQALDQFQIKWEKRYPMIAWGWRGNWDRVRPMFDYRLKFAVRFTRPMSSSRSITQESSLISQ